MKELPLNALRAFAVVYASGGVRAAARELGIAHSAVSRHLAELDAWLGVPIIHPPAGRRGLTFTPQGEALGRATLSGLREIARAVASIRETRSEGSVTISTTPSFAARWLLPRLPALEEAHPHIEVSVVVDSRIIDLGTGEADLAIRMGRGPWRDVDCEPLMEDSLYPVMSPALWKKSGRPDKPDGLTRLRLLHDRDPETPWERWKAAHGPASLDVHGGPRFASSDLVLRAALLGQGVALARHQLAADDVASGALLRPLGDLSVELGTAYWVVLPKYSQVKPATRTVADWLKDQASLSPVG
ncbi:LysR family transcriptional regulator [Myxococcus sp. CA056]|uniref:LysR substrate-binding domain-containing protein n=1 Tax=Myxococcus sp. CA056 TaxID=2741740 RepID=UPI00157AC6F6|nr:LysR substrate-binding domain-containing protein [Myxococcus sp. CA056]NTX17001.1 LysR family transcriptional regulator [Myxococcus sp. CA056]